MLIDLTHTISPETPVYPGDPSVELTQAGELSRDGFCDHKLSFGTHVGTHMDAPAHMLEGGKELKDYSVDRFVRTAVCIDARDGYDEARIREAVSEVGMAVLFFTGASEYFYEENYWHDYHVLSQACCQALIDKGVTLVGVDTGSVDNADGFPVHKALLGADILIIENLANLEEVVGKAFELTALPMKLEKDGAPARVIARI